MLDVLKVIILGIVAGITEWLPVRSTGHLILVGDLLSPGKMCIRDRDYQIIASDIILDSVEELDPEKPFHSLAKKIIRNMYNGSYSHKAQMVGQLADVYKRQADIVEPVIPMTFGQDVDAEGAEFFEICI